MSRPLFPPRAVTDAQRARSSGAQEDELSPRESRGMGCGASKRPVDPRPAKPLAPMTPEAQAAAQERTVRLLESLTAKTERVELPVLVELPLTVLRHLTPRRWLSTRWPSTVVVAEKKNDGPARGCGAGHESEIRAVRTTPTSTTVRYKNKIYERVSHSVVTDSHVSSSTVVS